MWIKSCGEGLGGCMEPGSAQWGERLKLEHFQLNRRKNFAVWVTEQ